jgi:hypothetical protein
LRANFFTVPVDVLRPPDPDARTAIQRRLENSAYRCVMVGSPQEFPTYTAPHLSQFWHLRVVEGYIAGVPRRLSALPWPKGVQYLRSLSFHRTEELSWPLLALLNVKYAVKVNPAFYYNLNCKPEQLEVLENPLPVVPRHFFVQSVEPAVEIPAAAALLPTGAAAEPASGAKQQTELNAYLPENPLKVSRVEGINAPTRYSVSGHLVVRYANDKIDIYVDAASSARFLVLNELYHPRWLAYADGKGLKVYPANQVMRGVEVPAGATHIEMFFQPFMRTPAARVIVCLGLTLLAAGFGVFKAIEGSDSR